MKIRITCIVSLILVSLEILNSCKKDDDSAYQPAGSYGNANIVNSEIFVLNDWTVGWDDGNNFAYSSMINTPIITQDIFDHGMIMVYWKLSDNWQALPVSYSSASFSLSKNFLVKPGQIQIQYYGYNSSGSDPLSYVIGQEVRFVAVSAQTIKAHPQTNWNNYNEVMQTLSLTEK